MIYVVPPDVGFSLTPVTTYSYLTICIRDYLKDILVQYCSTAAILFEQGENLVNLCESYKFKSGMDEDTFFDELFDLLRLDKSKHVKTLAQSNPNDIVAKAVTYINEHINEKITLDDIAKNVHVSKYHLLREFQKRMSVTPKQYIFQGKMRQARQEIMTEKSIAEIAADLNFSAQSHLCSVFKKYMGISVTDYKNKITKVEKQQ